MDHRLNARRSDRKAALMMERRIDVITLAVHNPAHTGGGSV
jgi:hypothetical protein